MQIFRNIWRLFHIQYVLVKYRLDEFIATDFLALPFKLFRLFYIHHWFKKDESRGIRARKACEELGPIFVKCGQLLSTRLDLLPADIAEELVKLQDSVPPFCGHKAKQILERAFATSIDKLFKEFYIKPLASASIAQVHRAVLMDGKDVVVKIIRPRIEKEISRDIELISSLGKLTERYWKHSKQFRILEVIDELKKSIFDELDMDREAANASQLKRNFTNSELLYVPEIYWDYTKKNILVMEYIDGIPVSNIEKLQQHKVNFKLLAERGVKIFFTQVFRDCFFHADMHPGNVWVNKQHPDNPQYMALDFGIIGTLSPEDQRYLAENFLAFFKRDYRRVAILHIESGWVPQDTRVDEFESAIRCVCEPIFQKPLKDISFGKTLMRLFQVARRFHMTVQPQLILLQKTLISVEGLGRQLYPDLDLWNTAKPFLEQWMKQKVGPRALAKNLVNELPLFLEKLPEIPKLIYQSLQHGTKNNSIIHLNNQNLNKACYKFSLGLVTGIIFGCMLSLILFKF